MILQNMHSVFFDEEFWGDPNAFRPERFLDSNGSLIQSKVERIFVFGAGNTKEILIYAYVPIDIIVL